MEQETLSEKIESIERIIYANEGAKKLGTNGIAGDIIFKNDVKEKITTAKRRLKEIINLFQTNDCLNGYASSLKTKIDKIFKEEFGEKLT